MYMTKRSALLALLVSLCVLPACPKDGDPTPAIDARVDPPVTLEWNTVVEGYAPGAIFSGWAGGPDDVWLVGGERGRSVVLHYDGTAWESRDPGLNEQLWWVHGFPDGTVYVCGDHGAVARWNGSAWEPLDSGAPGTVFYGVWGATPDDIWLVGGPTRTPVTGVEPEGDVVLRFDGSAFQREEIPALIGKPASAQKDLFKVWGASADQVFIVGSVGQALHYDGTSWEKVPTPVVGALFTVSGRSATDVYAVGGEGGAFLIHWDGTAWNEIDLPVGAPPTIQGVWTAPGEPVYVGGWYGFTAALTPGGTWTVANTATQLAYHSVLGDGNGSVWATGGDIYALLADYQGIILSTRDGVPTPP
jgi:hypothetical protein